MQMQDWLKSWLISSSKVVAALIIVFLAGQQKSIGIDFISGVRAGFTLSINALIPAVILLWLLIDIIQRRLDKAVVSGLAIILLMIAAPFLPVFSFFPVDLTTAIKTLKFIAGVLIGISLPLNSLKAFSAGMQPFGAAMGRRIQKRFSKPRPVSL